MGNSCSNCVDSKADNAGDSIPEYQPNVSIDPTGQNANQVTKLPLRNTNYSTNSTFAGGAADPYHPRDGPTGNNDITYSPRSESLSVNYFERDMEELEQMKDNNTRISNNKEFKFQSGSVYIGEWLNNERHGYGKQVWADNTVYEGQWRNNKAHGLGRFVHSDNDVYIGEWQFNKANGYGTYYHNNNVTMYRGEWLDDLQHGYGVEIWNDNSYYEGQFSHGKKNGEGMYCWSDQSKYIGKSFRQDDHSSQITLSIGKWINNKINGHGIYLGKENRMYRGEWLESEMNGIGVYTWKDGRKYEGQYLKDKKEGFGCFNWVDGRRYHGYWLNGKQEGEGRYFNTNSDQQGRLGEWSNGKKIKWLEEK